MAGYAPVRVISVNISENISRTSVGPLIQNDHPDILARPVRIRSSIKHSRRGPADNQTEGEKNL
jgi:hypothetical protein